jgi:HTH-type transcriptional regulator/antitoxin HigA
MTRKDLEALLGGRGRVSEILTRKRSLSLEMIHRLHGKLRIPLESLIGTAA